MVQELKACVASNASVANNKSRDFSFVAAASKLLKQLINLIDHTVHSRRPFTLFDRVEGVEDFEERVASLGTHFVHSDFLVQTMCGPGQQVLTTLY